METPDPPSDTPGASKKVFLTPLDIPRILRVEHNPGGLVQIMFLSKWVMAVGSSG